MKWFGLLALLVATCGCGLQGVASEGARPCPDPKCATTGTVCGTDMKSCRKFANQCEFQRANCKAPTWQQTDGVHCRSFRVGVTQSCGCPELRTCSGKDMGICVKGAKGCKLLKNECELIRAKCSGEAWTNIDSLQCKGLSFGQTQLCACPKLENCSSSVANICVQGLKGCTWFTDECALERARCLGEKLTKLPDMQCRGIRAGETKRCFCPKLQTCTAAGPNVCVKGRSGCMLMKTECEMERTLCMGESWQRTDPVQCQNIKLGEVRTCGCPKLESCANATQTLCVQGSSGCKLLRNRCDLERALCKGEKWTATASVQCKNYKLSETKACTCPKLQNCSSYGPSICVKDTNGCKLIKSECDLEEALCNGEKLSRVGNSQCRAFTLGDLKPCSCPKLQNCSSAPKRICVKSPRGCKIMASECEWEKAVCQKEGWVRTDDLQCKNFTVGELKTCTCPQLESCSRSSKPKCVSGSSGCKLMSNLCELVRARCRGENWSPVDDLQCRNFTLNASSACACPRLLQCSTTGPSICAQGAGSCKLYEDECAFERARCKDPTHVKVDRLRCKGFSAGDERQCTCPTLETCSKTPSQVCIKSKGNCQWAGNSCDLERAKCEGKDWVKTHAVNCWKFRPREIKPCGCPCLENCSNSTNVCGVRGSFCKNFKTECDMRKSICRGERWTLTRGSRCHGIGLGLTKECACPRARGCSMQRGVCGRRGQQCKNFNTDCDFKNALCSGESWRHTNSAHCCQFSSEATGNCTLNATRRVCATINNQICQNFRTQCEFQKVNKQLAIKWRAIHPARCKCMKPGDVKACTVRPTCKPGCGAANVCGRKLQQRRLFESQCHLQRHNFNRCDTFKEVPIGECKNVLPIGGKTCKD